MGGVRASSAPAAAGSLPGRLRRTPHGRRRSARPEPCCAGAGLCDLFRRFGGRSIVVVMSVMGDAVGLCCRRHARIAAECTRHRPGRLERSTSISGQARNRFIVLENGVPPWNYRGPASLSVKFRSVVDERQRSVFLPASLHPGVF